MVICNLTYIEEYPDKESDNTNYILSKKVNISLKYNIEFNMMRYDKLEVIKKYNKNNKIITKKRELPLENYKYIIDQIGRLSLEELKNNYYNPEMPYCFNTWTLEYEQFKVVGTIDKLPEEVKYIKELLNFDKINL